MAKDFISWQQIQADCKSLAEKIQAREERYEGILCVTRGGLIPSGILSELLSIYHVETVCIQSYDEETNQQTKFKVLKPLPEQIVADKGKGWLVVDDLVDSGKTLRYIRESIPEALFCVLYAKPEGKSCCDLYITDKAQGQWIVFPWEE